MSNSDKCYTPVRPRLLRALSLVPVLAAIAAVFTFYAFGDTHTILKKWGGIALVEPVDEAKAKVYEDQGEALFEVQQSLPVRAAMAGVVSAVSSRTLETVNGSVTVKYRGLVLGDIKIGKKLTRGEVIGKLEVGRPDPLSARLWMQLSRDDRIIPPPLKPRFENRAQRILSLGCVGCHQMREIYPLSDGRMRNGALATESAIAESIRHGGKVRGPMAMPPFKDSLSEEEIRAVTVFLCRNRCTAEVAQAEQPRR
jgi:cytochrome c553